MKAIVNTAPGKLEWRELPLPKPRAGEVRIRAGACGVCATDLAMIAGWERTGFPSIPGHEWSGTVDAAGRGVSRSLVGRRCVGENVLSEGGEVGFERPGGYAECFLTEAARLEFLPEDFPFATAALIEPLAVCVRGARRLRIKDASSALVFGDGPIGLLMLMLLRREGVRSVTLVGGRIERLRLARGLGAARTVNYHAARDLSKALRRPGRFGFPNVVEASGSAASMEAAMHAAAPGGKVLVLGDYGAAHAAFLWNHLLWREIELIASNASAGAWCEAARLAREGTLPLARLVTHRFPAARFAEAIDLLRARACGVVKIVLDWQ